MGTINTPVSSLYKLSEKLRNHCILFLLCYPSGTTGMWDIEKATSISEETEDYLYLLTFAFFRILNKYMEIYLTV